MMKRKQPLDDTINTVAKMSKLEEDSNVSVSEKQQRYDRQLRLWGDHGQQALEKAFVCLINASAVGTETLKCLVLPGVGSFTIIDSNVVRSEDISNNFFMDSNSLGKSRAETACKLLVELNDEVRGEYISKNPVQLIEEDICIFQRFSLVIASGLPESTLLKLSSFLWDTGIPFLVLESVGFLGYARLVLPEHTVIESHPDNVLEDLRLDKPFDELKAFLNSINMDSMTRQEHSHTPYLVIIYKALQQWISQNGKWPASYKEKKEIKEIISKGVRRKENENDEEEENFEEALKNVNNVVVQTKIPSNIQEILTESMSSESDKTTKFWILARALAEFVKRHSTLPLRGSIPDMFSDSERYIKLQNIYREKALSDAEEVHSIMREQLKCQNTNSEITPEEVRHFCKNSHQLYFSRGKPLTTEFAGKDGKNDLEQYAENEEGYPDFKLYIIFRSLLKYLDKHSAYPGQSMDDSDSDLSAFKGIVQHFCSEFGGSFTDLSSYVEELGRCKFSELHSVSAVLGGLVAHEVIKVITRQFVPVNNCFLYNAMSQTTLTLTLP